MSILKTPLPGSPGRRAAGLRHLVAALAVVAFASGTASAQYVYPFEGITTNNPGDVAIGESQLRLAVTGVVIDDVDYVDFTFTNATGGLASSITGVYFYDGELLEDGEILASSGGVTFSDGANPKHLTGLPQGGPEGVASPLLYSAGSDAPVRARGVDPGESLTIRFGIAEGHDLVDILDALSQGVTTDGLIVGIRVQGFASGGSESFVAVPEPASLTMLGMSALAGLGYARRKRKRAVT